MMVEDFKVAYTSVAKPGIDAKKMKLANLNLTATQFDRNISIHLTTFWRVDFECTG